jgi:hypothetical protein
MKRSASGGSESRILEASYTGPLPLPGERRGGVRDREPRGGGRRQGPAGRPPRGSAFVTFIAHGFVGRSDLPIPEWLFGWAAAMVRYPLSLLFGVYFLTITSFTSMTALLALFLEARFGLGAENMGIIFALAGGAMIMGTLPTFLLGPMAPMVGEELRPLGPAHLCGVDIIPEAAEAPQAPPPADSPEAAGHLTGRSGA